MAAYLAPSTCATEYMPPVRLKSEVRGFITERDETGDSSYLYVRDYRQRHMKLRVREAALAHEITRHIKEGMLSMQVEGYWERTENGWLPCYGECEVRSFIALDMNCSLADSLDLLTSMAAEGWNALDDPIAAWKDIRGCE
jgi:hypothetical protein